MDNIILKKNQKIKHEYLVKRVMRKIHAAWLFQYTHTHTHKRHRSINRKVLVILFDLPH